MNQVAIIGQYAAQVLDLEACLLDLGVAVYGPYTDSEDYLNRHNGGVSAVCFTGARLSNGDRELAERLADLRISVVILTDYPAQIPSHPGIVFGGNPTYPCTDTLERVAKQTPRSRQNITVGPALAMSA